jgi:hypothetical protein
MTSLARHIVLRSTGPHRNLPCAFRGQQRLRHLHETAEKPVFRWEVRIRPPGPTPNVQLCWILNGKLNPLGPFGT